VPELHDQRRDELRAELARLRLLAGLGGRPLAKAIGSTQATVSRVERGAVVPSVPMVRAWSRECGAGEAEQERLAGLAEAVQAGVRGWSLLLDEHGHAHGEARAREAMATLIRNFQPTVVPGLLQTPEYALAVLSIGRTRRVEAAVAERIERQQRLYDHGRRFEFLIWERVLTWPIGGHEVLAAQRDRMVSLSRLASVKLAVLPSDATVLTPWSNFAIWYPEDGPSFAASETFVGQQRISDPGDLALLTDVWSGCGPRLPTGRTRLT
jgi:transcriptional regulator with XRE-family HTH domain